MEVRLLTFETDLRGDALPTVKEIQFGKPLTEARDVELGLRRAQLAILNPTIDPMKFVELEKATLKNGPLAFEGSDPPLEFSSNVICVDISGPEVTDLAFVDLPVRGFSSSR